MSRNEYEKQRRQQYHQGNLQQAGAEQPGEAAEILSALSHVEDLPIDPQNDSVMGQLVSRLTSTANLSAEQVRSNEWVREYLMVLYLCRFPREDGLHDTWRGIAHGDVDEERDPLDPQKRLEIEAFVSMSKLALSRSEDFTAPREAVRNVNESIVNEEGGNSDGDGLLGRIGF